jgi:hypothetical protein
MLIEIDENSTIKAPPVLSVLVFGARAERIGHLSIFHHEIVNFPNRIVSRRGTQYLCHLFSRHPFRDAVELTPRKLPGRHVNARILVLGAEKRKEYQSESSNGNNQQGTTTSGHNTLTSASSPSLSPPPSDRPPAIAASEIPAQEKGPVRTIARRRFRCGIRSDHQRAGVPPTSECPPAGR